MFFYLIDFLRSKITVIVYNFLIFYVKMVELYFFYYKVLWKTI